MPAAGERMERIGWRLVAEGEPGAPGWNMALDEALLACWREGDPPLLRLYGWRPPALSLGRFQAADDVALPAGATLVRRISGGAAIHHRQDEVTYAVVAPYRLFPAPHARSAYRAVHAVIAEALAQLGLPAPDPEEAGPRAARAHPRGMCFATAIGEDLVVGGRKLVGSAQRRQGGAFLQHGSIPLSPDPAGAGTSLAELLGAAPERASVVRAICAAMRHTLATHLNRAPPTEAERLRAQELLASRYGLDAWNRDGRTP